MGAWFGTVSDWGPEGEEGGTRTGPLFAAQPCRSRRGTCGRDRFAVLHH